MEWKSSLHLLRFARALLRGNAQQLLPFNAYPQKPIASGMLPQPLLRSTPKREGLAERPIMQFLETINCQECAPQALLMLCHGKVVCQTEWPPYTLGQWHVSHSLCKSFTGTAIGLLIQEGLLSLQDTVGNIFHNRMGLRTNRFMQKLTIHHLLSMQSGVSFKEASCVCCRDWVQGFLESDFLFEPGSRFDYNSMNSYLLSAIVQKITGLSLTDYLRPRLFVPLGFGDVAWECCPLGIVKGGWGMYLYLEDAAKLGQLYLQRGSWKMPNGINQQLIAHNWIAQAAKCHCALPHGSGYGYHLWYTGSQGFYLFNGMFGQYVFVVPDLQLVLAVFSGAEHLLPHSKTYFAAAKLFEQLRQSTYRIPSCRPLPKALTYCSSVVRPLSLQKRRKAIMQTEQLLAGRCFVFEENQADLFPRILGCMNHHYAGGIRLLRFEMACTGLSLLCTVEKTLYRIPLGLDKPAPFLWNASGNLFHACACTQLRTDEDDRPVLKTEIFFTESTSRIVLKLFLPVSDNSRVLLFLQELPNPCSVLDKLADQNQLAQQANAMLQKAGYLGYRIRQLATPVIYGTEQTEKY